MRNLLAAPLWRRQGMETTLSAYPWTCGGGNRLDPKGRGGGAGRPADGRGAHGLSPNAENPARDCPGRVRHPAPFDQAACASCRPATSCCDGARSGTGSQSPPCMAVATICAASAFLGLSSGAGAVTRASPRAWIIPAFGRRCQKPSTVGCHHSRISSPTASARASAAGCRTGALHLNGIDGQRGDEGQQVEQGLLRLRQAPFEQVARDCRAGGHPRRCRSAGARHGPGLSTSALVWRSSGVLEARNSRQEP